MCDYWVYEKSSTYVIREKRSYVAGGVYVVAFWIDLGYLSHIVEEFEGFSCKALHPHCVPSAGKGLSGTVRGHCVWGPAKDS
jgi:hypothetical protein